MKRREEIRTELINALLGTNSNWRKLQSSLIGKELIEYGVEVIAAANDVADSMLSAYDYISADEKSLISMAHVNNIPISFIQPTFIRLTLNGAPAQTYKPFDLQATIGNSTFTNISYYKSTDVITLYQGVVCTSFNNSTISPFRYDNEVVWDNTTFSIDSENTITGHSLGMCMPESVYVFYVEQQSQSTTVASIMSPYKPMTYGPEVICYKLYTSMDRNTLMLEGDDIWGRNTSGFSKQILWLAPTSNTFEPSSNIAVFYNGSAQPISLGVTVKGFSVGGESIEYARDSFRRYYLSQNAIVSKQQIKDFVNSYSYVQDSSVSILNNIVNIYIKPTDPSDTGGYGDIENELDLFGGIINNYIITNGTPIPFTFHFKTTDATVNRADIDQYITSEYSYSDMTFEQDVDTASVAAKIQSLFGKYINVSLYVSNVVAFSGSKLAFVPLANTITLKSNGISIGGDVNGSLYVERRADTTVLMPITSNNYSVNFGKYIQFSTNSFVTPEFSEETELYTKVVDSSVLSEFLSADFSQSNLFTHNGYTYIYNQESIASLSSIRVFANSQINSTMLLSPTQPISGTSPKIIGTTTSAQTSSASKVPFFYKGLYYIVNVSASGVQLEHYTGDNASPYFIYNITSTGHKLLGLYIGDDELYIVCDGNSIIVVKNFNSPQPSWINYGVVLPTNVTGTIRAFHAYDSTNCVALFATGNSNTGYLVKMSGLSTVGSEVSLTGAVVLGTVPLSSTNEETMQVYCTDSWIWFLQPNTSIVVFGTNQYSMATVGIVEGTYILDQNCLAGSINYSDGTVVYNTNLISANSGITFSYDAIVFNRDKSNYLVLNTNNPIVWN